MTERFLRHLPIGERPEFSADGMPGWEIFPFEGELTVKVLDGPVLPEPPRNGASGSCFICRDQAAQRIWADEHWLVRHTGGPTAVPVTVLLSPVAHHDLGDLPAERAAEIGPLMQRMERAIEALGGIGRVHSAKWGDGAEHLHLWFFGRPAGLMQLRGSCLTIWDDVLPKQDETAWRGVLSELAANLAAGGGTAYV
ncbi:HIT family protein [Symbioplanes lichenis]|uniref:HIT family protein n=1 Tax=Symbioplanes lichenis TaxID=1629072 RepID=UPI0027392397|nr:hypothetical protein [Actinoplanes lichenis]